jgi:phage FluMu protein Com
MAKEEYEMPQSESDVESESGEEDRKSDKSDNESEYDGDNGDDNGDDDGDDDDDGESEKLACNHCGKETGHIVYLMKCPRCSWNDFYWGKDAQCMICDEQSPLLFSHVIGFCELCSYGTSNSKAGGVEFTPKMDK